MTDVHRESMTPSIQVATLGMSPSQKVGMNVVEGMKFLSRVEVFLWTEDTVHEKCYEGI